MVAIGIIAASLCVGIWMSWKRSLRPEQSDNIIAQWDGIDGESWLLPNLRDMRVVQPDRPHSFQEIHAWRKGEYTGIKRTREYRLRTNSDRLRGPELGPKDPNTIRILAIGDSVTHGWGVAEEESYPAVLQIMLRARGHQVEVLNAGVPSNTDIAMQLWCTRFGAALKPDVVLWTRRVLQRGPNPYNSYTRAAKACKRATGAPLIVVLPPVSTFDLKGTANWSKERDRITAELGSSVDGIVELSPIFKAAQAGRGVALEQRGFKLAVVDQRTGIAIIEVPPTHRDLPAEIYALFEQNLQLREALFFDDGHPDAEGFRVFAEALVAPIEAVLPP
jgi:lysophospholipase L1-like esterase